MSPESREILRKWLDSWPSSWPPVADLASGVAIQQTSVVDGEIVIQRIEPEEFYLMPDEFKLTRRRESVTAVEVIAKLREVPYGWAAIQMIETIIAEICRTGGVEEKT